MKKIKSVVDVPSIPRDDEDGVYARRVRLDRFVKRQKWTYEQSLHTLAAYVFRQPAVTRKFTIAWLKELLFDLKDTRKQGGDK